jgi:hypothetical protein
MWIYTRVSIRGLGWCVSRRKVKLKISWDCPYKLARSLNVYSLHGLRPRG